MCVTSAKYGTTFSSYLSAASSILMGGGLLLPDFAAVKNLENLAKLIGIELTFLNEVISVDDRSSFYQKHEIPKRKSGAIRTVWEADSPELVAAHKSFQRKFEYFAERRCGYPGGEAHGYIRGRSTVTNAAVHAGNHYLLHADIENFFETITIHRVEGLFRDLGIVPDISAALSRLETVS